MKVTTIYVDDNKVELYNSLLGKEIVRLNNEIVSSKFSVFGAKHFFYINEYGKQVLCNLNVGFGFNGVNFNLFKDNKPIIESPKTVIPTVLVVVLSVMFILMFIAMIIFLYTVLK